MMTRAEMKQKAKEMLDKKIFGETWMLALVVCLIFTALTSACASIIPFIGELIILGPLTVGVCALFVKLTREGGKINVGDMFSGFSKDFGGNLLLGLLTTIFIALWSLLFVIPGIVKTYAYSQAFYIKNDHPDYGWKQCIDESRAMMKGHKWELFVLDLSFIGWYIVGSLCLGVGTLWVLPYHNATRAVYYNELCGGAINVAYEEVGGESEQKAWY